MNFFAALKLAPELLLAPAALALIPLFDPARVIKQLKDLPLADFLAEEKLHP